MSAHDTYARLFGGPMLAREFAASSSIRYQPPGVVTWEVYDAMIGTLRRLDGGLDTLGTMSSEEQTEECEVTVQDGQPFVLGGQVIVERYGATPFTIDETSATVPFVMLKLRRVFVERVRRTNAERV